jgi:hypothetical protein
MFEKIMNVIIQNKIARRRLAKIQDITSNLVFAKVTDGKNDKVKNKNVTDLETGLMFEVSSPDKIPTPVNLGGQKQIVELTNAIQQSKIEYNQILKTPEVLSGDAKTLGANQSGVAIQSLAEYASSVHKDVKKRYARKVEWEYQNFRAPYILKVFNSTNNIKKYLSDVEWGIVKKHIINYELAIKQATYVAENKNPEEIQSLLIEDRERMSTDFNDKKIISKEILEQLKKEVRGIKIVVSGEKVSRQIRSEFIAEIKKDYKESPEILRDNTYLAIIKKQAKVNGIDELEVTEFINQLK